MKKFKHKWYEYDYNVVIFENGKFCWKPYKRLKKLQSPIDIMKNILVLVMLGVLLSLC